jgi:hypothetical protein
MFLIGSCALSTAMQHSVKKHVTTASYVFLLALAACAAEGPGENSRFPQETVAPSDEDPAEADDGEPSDPVEDAAAIVSSTPPTTMAGGAAAEVEVTVRNDGTATWTSDYRLGAVDDSDPFFSEGRVFLDADVPPGASDTFRFTLTAPTIAGTFTSDWRMVHELVRWFGPVLAVDVVVDCPEVPYRSGLVRAEGRGLVDDTGPFDALGATMFWAAWAYKNDRPKLEENLAFLANNGFHYFRALGTVGDYGEADFWDGREIDWHWDDYDDVIAGVTDLAFDTYGLRVEWTLIGDGQLNIPNESDRYAHVDRFLAMSEGREHKIILFEIANEAWQNGFAGSDGTAQLRALSQYMKDRTEILVAASAPAGGDCATVEELYAGGVADVATIHFDREINLVDGRWRPVRQPWGFYADGCDVGGAIGANNEPIGPGASVNTDGDPARMAASALVTFVASLPFHVFHSNAGVRGDIDLFDIPAATAFKNVLQRMPAGVSGWERKNHYWDGHPFVIYRGAGDGSLVANEMWPDEEDSVSGAVRAYAAVNGADFVMVPIGVLGSVVMDARYDLDFEVIDVLTGQTTQTGSLDAGQRLTLSGAETFLVKGTFR